MRCKIRVLAHCAVGFYLAIGVGVVNLKSDCIWEALREAAGRHVHADNVCNLDGSKPSLKRPMSNDSSAQQACNVKTNIEPFFTTIYKPALINPRHEAKNAVNEWQRRAADVFHA